MRAITIEIPDGVLEELTRDELTLLTYEGLIRYSVEIGKIDAASGAMLLGVPTAELLENEMIADSNGMPSREIDELLNRIEARQIKSQGPETSAELLREDRDR